MNNKNKILLQKIIAYIDEISDFINGLDFEQFEKEKKTVSACAFTISQIGELSKNIDMDIQAKYTDVPWVAMRGMRNRIVHDYEGVDLEVLWGTIKNSLPKLSSQLKEIIEKTI
jgi:uncharacterized protein with HEPN domain